MLVLCLDILAAFLLSKYIRSLWLKIPLAIFAGLASIFIAVCLGALFAPNVYTGEVVVAKLASGSLLHPTVTLVGLCFFRNKGGVNQTLQKQALECEGDSTSLSPATTLHETVPAAKPSTDNKEDGPDFPCPSPTKGNFSGKTSKVEEPIISHLDKENASPKADNVTTRQLFPESKYDNAILALKYRKDINQAFGLLTDFPQKIQNHFLEILEREPKVEVDVLKKEILSSYVDWFNPRIYKNDRANKALALARCLGDEAENELKNMISLLGEDLDYCEIETTFKEKYMKGVELPKFKDLHEYEEFYKKNLRDLMSDFEINYDGQINKYIFNNVSYEKIIDAIIVAHSSRLDLVKYYKERLLNL
jgi:hypothetical protein